MRRAVAAPIAHEVVRLAARGQHPHARPVGLDHVDLGVHPAAGGERKREPLAVRATSGRRPPDRRRRSRARDSRRRRAPSRPGEGRSRWRRRRASSRRARSWASWRSPPSPSGRRAAPRRRRRRTVRPGRTGGRAAIAFLNGFSPGVSCLALRIASSRSASPRTPRLGHAAQGRAVSALFVEDDEQVAARAMDEVEPEVGDEPARPGCCAGRGRRRRAACVKA